MLCFMHEVQIFGPKHKASKRQNRHLKPILQDTNPIFFHYITLIFRVGTKYIIINEEVNKYLLSETCQKFQSQNVICSVKVQCVFLQYFGSWLDVCTQEFKRQMNSVYYFLAYIILFSAQSSFFTSLSYFLSSKL